MPVKTAPQPLSISEIAELYTGYDPNLVKNPPNPIAIKDGLKLVKDLAVYRAFLYDASVGYTDYTAQINDGAANDVPLLPNPVGVGDAFYFGSLKPLIFTKVKVTTANTGSAKVEWEMWNGGAWVENIPVLITLNAQRWLTVTTEGICYQRATQAPVAVNLTTCYWVRAKYAGGTVLVQPLAEQAWLGSDPFAGYHRLVNYPRNKTLIGR